MSILFLLLRCIFFQSWQTTTTLRYKPPRTEAGSGSLIHVHMRIIIRPSWFPSLSRGVCFCVLVNADLDEETRKQFAVHRLLEFRRPQKNRVRLREFDGEECGSLTNDIQQYVGVLKSRAVLMANSWLVPYRCVLTHVSICSFSNRLDSSSDINPSNNTTAKYIQKRKTSTSFSLGIFVPLLIFILLFLFTICFGAAHKVSKRAKELLVLSRKYMSSFCCTETGEKETSVCQVLQFHGYDKVGREQKEHELGSLVPNLHRTACNGRRKWKNSKTRQKRASLFSTEGIDSEPECPCC